MEVPPPPPPRWGNDNDDDDIIASPILAKGRRRQQQQQKQQQQGRGGGGGGEDDDNGDDAHGGGRARQRRQAFGGENRGHRRRRHCSPPKDNRNNIHNSQQQQQQHEQPIGRGHNNDAGENRHHQQPEADTLVETTTTTAAATATPTTTAQQVAASSDFRVPPRGLVRLGLDQSLMMAHPPGQQGKKKHSVANDDHDHDIKTAAMENKRHNVTVRGNNNVNISNDVGESKALARDWSSLLIDSDSDEDDEDAVWMNYTGLGSSSGDAQNRSSKKKDPPTASSTNQQDASTSSDLKKAPPQATKAASTHNAPTNSSNDQDCHGQGGATTTTMTHATSNSHMPTTQLCDIINRELDNMGRALRCPICQAAYQDAVTLSNCVHAYCRNCIQHHFQQQRKQSRSYSCPSCQTPATGHRSLMDAPSLNRIVADYKMALRHFGLAPMQYTPGFAGLTQIVPSDTRTSSSNNDSSQDDENITDDTDALLAKVAVWNQSSSQIDEDSADTRALRVSQTFLDAFKRMAQAQEQGADPNMTVATVQHQQQHPQQLLYQQQRLVVAANARALLPRIISSSRTVAQAQVRAHASIQAPPPPLPSFSQLAAAAQDQERADQEWLESHDDDDGNGSADRDRRHANKKTQQIRFVATAAGAATKTTSVANNTDKNNHATYYPTDEDGDEGELFHSALQLPPQVVDMMPIPASATAPTNVGPPPLSSSHPHPNDISNAKRPRGRNRTTRRSPATSKTMSTQDHPNPTMASASTAEPSFDECATSVTIVPAVECPTTFTELATAVNLRTSISIQEASRIDAHSIEEPAEPPSLLLPVGTVVHVQARTWSGINKHGGVGRIKRVDVATGHYDIAYVLGGSEKNVDAIFVQIALLDGGGTDRGSAITNDPPPAVTDCKCERKSGRLARKRQEEIPPQLLVQLAAEGFEVPQENRVAARRKMARCTLAGGMKRPLSMIQPKMKADNSGSIKPHVTRKRAAADVSGSETTNLRPTKRSKPTMTEPVSTTNTPPMPRANWTPRQLCDLANAHYGEQMEAILHSSSTEKTIYIVSTSLSGTDMQAIRKLVAASKKYNVALKLQESYHPSKTNVCIISAANGPSSGNHPTNLQAASRTVKAMRAALQGIPLVTPEWIYQCLKAKQVILPDQNSMYIRRLPSREGVDVIQFGVAFMAAALHSTGSTWRLLPQYRILPFGFSPSKADDVKLLIRECGAELILQLPAKTIPTTVDPVVAVVIVDETDPGAIVRLQQAYPDVLDDWTILHSQWLFDSIACGHAQPIDAYSPNRSE